MPRAAACQSLPRPRRPASCLPASSMRCATGKSGPWPPAAARSRPGEQARTRAARDRPQVWPPPCGGAAAALIDPAARTRTAPCPRGRNRGNPEGMTAARRLPDTRLHRGAGTQPHTVPFPPPHYRIADGRLKDACGAADAAGLRPVPDPPARSPEMAAAGNRPHQGPGLVQHGLYSGVPGHGPDTGKKGTKPRLDTVRSFRDDLRQRPSTTICSSHRASHWFEPRSIAHPGRRPVPFPGTGRFSCRATLK